MKSFAKARSERNKARLAKSASLGSSVPESPTVPGKNLLATLFKKQQEKWDAQFMDGSGNSNASVEQVNDGNADCELIINSSDESDSASTNTGNEASSSSCSRVNYGTDPFQKDTSNSDIIRSTFFNSNSCDITDKNELGKTTTVCDPTTVTTSAHRNSFRERNRLTLKRKSSSPSKPVEMTLSSSQSYSSVSDLTTVTDLNTVTDSTTVTNFVPNNDEETLDGSEQHKEQKVFRSPYYLENFLSVITDVLSDEFYSDLFNEEDRSIVNRFINDVDDTAKKLYIRLFLRKPRWLKKDKISYPQISPDLTNSLENLSAQQFLLDDSSMHDLSEVLDCLPTPDLRTVAKTLQIKFDVPRPQLISQILSHSRRNSITSFFTRPASASKRTKSEDNQANLHSNAGVKDFIEKCGGGGVGGLGSQSSACSSIQSSILKRCRTLLGRCYKINIEIKSVFSRMMMLIGLHNTVGDDDNTDQQQILFQMLLMEMGFLKFPGYEIKRRTRIFSDRDSLIRYATAMQLESDMCHSMERKNIEESLEINRLARICFNQLYDNSDILLYESNLPPFLRIYTATTVYTRVMSYGVEVLQTAKLYEEAVNQLRFLIEQGLYLTNHRGLWYDRLALNLDFHLKQPLEALAVIRVALKEDCVRTGRRFNLLLRAKKICGSSSMKKKALSDGTLPWDEFKNDHMANVPEAPTVTIVGNQLPHGKPGAPAVWYVSDVSDAEITDTSEMCVYTRVEDFALRHYADHGYPQGIHGEGSTFTTLFSLFMWDVIFMSGVDDVFYNKNQAAPLDLHSDHFYSSRCDVITQRLELIASMSEQELCETVQNTWELHKDEQCRTMDWEKFSDLEHALGLVRCLTGPQISGILDRMSRTLRQVTGGVPDLVVWNPETKKCKVVEVKGPGDKLSTKQILWLDYLVKLGVDAETCYVKAATGRKFNRSSSL